MKARFWLTAFAVAVATANSAVATTSIQYFEQLDPGIATHTDASDYSDAGIDIGNAGFLFFNFGASAPNDGPADQNVVNALPSWIGVDFDPSSPTYSFGQDVGEEAFSRGGQSSWANLTLPDGTSGLSGALVDPRATDNSNNTIKQLDILPGAPRAFWLHIVTDNTNLEHDSANRVRAREDVSDLDVRVRTPPFNGEPDVYSFLYSGVAVGDFIKVQLNSGVAGEAPSIAGVMFDLVPEPTSGLLLACGCLALSGVRRRQLT